jgi:multicomponent Na+:H+ antiporter subunit D
MLNTWLVFPILIPLFTAILCLFAYRSRAFQRITSIAGAALLFAASVWLLVSVYQSGIQVLPLGNWPAPYGIVLVADLFSAVMVLLAGIIGLAVALYSLASIDPDREAYGYHPLYHFLLMGVCGAFLTGDLFNLYVWFEVMLMASFVLLALGGERGQMEGAIKYVTLNLIASALFLAAVGILYGLAGTLNMADLAIKFLFIEGFLPTGVLTAVAMLFLVAFGIKSAIFPLFFWLPASYHTPPVAVSALFAGLLTKVGVYALIRVFTLIFTQNIDYTQTIILVLAGFTMVTGVLGAVAQTEVRRLLTFHIISQIGYLLMGLGLFSPLALAAALYFTFHVSVAKVSLFLVSGLTGFLQGSYDLKKLGGLYRTRPVVAVLFLIPALSLAGIPPLSGFFAKVGLVQAGLNAGQYLLVGVSLAVSLLTLFSMMKIWNEAFWKPAPPRTMPVAETEITAGTANLTAWLMPIALLAAVTLVISFGAGGFFNLALQAGEQLLNPLGYVRAVLGGLP